MDLRIKREGETIWVSINKIMAEQYTLGKAKKLRRDLADFQYTLDNLIRSWESETEQKIDPFIKGTVLDFLKEKQAKHCGEDADLYDVAIEISYSKAIKTIEALEAGK